jgi:hypothetical protein
MFWSKAGSQLGDLFRRLIEQKLAHQWDEILRAALPRRSIYHVADRFGIRTLDGDDQFIGK